jgi:hypothetical protein
MVKNEVKKLLTFLIKFFFENININKRFFTSKFSINHQEYIQK